MTGLRDVGPDSGIAYLGFRRDVSEKEVTDWVEHQNVDGMLAALNRIRLSVGDAILVPAGVPHAIGPGVTVVELQEPADLSVLLEFTGFPGIDRSAAFLDLDEQLALTALDRSAWAGERLAELIVPRRLGWALPAKAEPFFRAERIVVDGTHAVDSGYAVFVVVDGAGELRTASGDVAVSRGATVLVPYGAGPVEITGILELVRCRPPAASRLSTGSRS